MNEKVIVRQQDDGIVNVELADPTCQNRLGPEMRMQLSAALSKLARLPSATCVILSGSGGIFCAGGSLEVIPEGVMGAEAQQDLLIQLVRFPLPVIGALDGSAVGGGLMLAVLLCDMMVADQDSRYGLNFVDLGFAPGMGATSLLPAMVGQPRAAEMVLTGKLYKGRELASTGLFNSVAPRGEVRGLALTLAKRVVEKPRHAVLAAKEALALPRRRALEDSVLREQLKHAVRLRTGQMASDALGQ